ncbi:ead/Ea22-like family protein [Klebsiella aerogenes]
MTTDITELAQSLKAAAEKATPGEWVYFPKNTSIEYDVGSDESQGSILYVDSGDFTQSQTDSNGEFIALANPANILALVEALEKAQRANGHLREQSAEWERKAISNFEECAKLSQRVEELESRTVTVKLPEVRITIAEAKLRNLTHQQHDAYNAGASRAVAKISQELTAQGIKWEAE